MDWPRYSTGYTALFNTIGVMIETHMLKPYDVRVKSTYDFLLAAMEAGLNSKDYIINLREDKINVLNTYPLDWDLDENAGDTLNFLGYEGEQRKSNVTGHSRLSYNRNKPFEKEILYKNQYEAANIIKVPEAYVVPQSWHNVMSLLVLNNVEFTQMTADTTI